MRTRTTVSKLAVAGSTNSPKFEHEARGGGRRGRLNFKKLDVVRLIEAAALAGVKAHRVEVTIGDTRISLLTSTGSANNPAADEDTPEKVIGLL